MKRAMEHPHLIDLIRILRDKHGLIPAQYLAKAYLFRLRAQELEEGDLLRDIVFDTYLLSLQDQADIEEALQKQATTTVEPKS